MESLTELMEGGARPTLAVAQAQAPTCGKIPFSIDRLRTRRWDWKRSIFKRISKKDKYALRCIQILTIMTPMYNIK